MANKVEIVFTSKDNTGPGVTSATKNVDKLRDSLKRMGEVAGGVLAADAIQAGLNRFKSFITSSIRAASDLQQAMGGVTSVFGQASDAINEFGDTAAREVGLSKAQFESLAAPLGASLRLAGFELDDVAAKTVELTKRAADMAATFGGTTAEALEAIQAGLRGEADPLERFGVGLSAAAVQAEALAETGKKAAATLTAQELATARVNLILKQTSSSAGQFAREQDSLAGSTQIATAKLEDAKAKIGTALLPVLAKAAEVAGTLAEGFSGLPGPLQLTAGAALAAGAAALILVPRIVATKQAFKDLSGETGFATHMLGKVAVTAGKVGAVLVGLQVAGAVLGDIMGHSATQVDAMGRSLAALDDKGATRDVVRKIVGDDLERYSRDMKLAAGSLDALKKSAAIEPGLLKGFSFSAQSALQDLTDLDAGLAKLVSDGHADAAGEVVRQLAEENAKAAVPVKDMNELLPQYASAMSTAGTATGRAAVEVEKMAATAEELTKALDDATEKAFGLQEAENAVRDASAAYTEEIDRQREANEEGAGTLDRKTEAGRQNWENLRALVEAEKDLVTANAQHGKSNDALIQKMYDQARALGASKEEAAAFVQPLKALNAQIKALHDKEIHIKIVEEHARQEQASHHDSYAHGGVVGASSQPAATGGVRSGPIRMNEQGIEGIHVPTGSTIIPHGQTMGLLNQAAAQPSYNVTWVTAGDALMTAFIEQINRYVRGAGGDGRTLGIVTVRG